MRAIIHPVSSAILLVAPFLLLDCGGELDGLHRQCSTDLTAPGCATDDGWDASGIDGDSCQYPATCSQSCGNGAVESGEACDDGNSADGDGCSAVCTVELGWTCSGPQSRCDEVCGDGQRVGAEYCDDGETDPCGACNADCSAEGVACAPCAAGITFTFTDYDYGRGTCTATTPDGTFTGTGATTFVPAVTCVPGTSDCHSSNNGIGLYCGSTGQWFGCGAPYDCHLDTAGRAAGSGWTSIAGNVTLAAANAACE